MDRRDFLRTVGLSGLALTLPKPLEVVAARMSDIEAPPLHVGLARFRDLQGILVRNFSLSLSSPVTNPDRIEEFSKAWSVHLAAHEKGRDYVPILHGMAKKYLTVKLSDDRSCIKSMSFQGGLPAMSLVGTMLDVYLVPEGRPRHPLPSLVTTLHGEATLRGNGILSNGNFPVITTDRTMDISALVRSVRLERARAIELGLVSPLDRFEIL